MNGKTLLSGRLGQQRNLTDPFRQDVIYKEGRKSNRGLAQF
jgi:hypothetical protein